MTPDESDFIRFTEACKKYRRSDNFFYDAEHRGQIKFYFFPHTNKTTRNQTWLQSKERGYTYLKLSELEAAGITIHQPTT